MMCVRVITLSRATPSPISRFHEPYNPTAKYKAHSGRRRHRCRPPYRRWDAFIQMASSAYWCPWATFIRLHVAEELRWLGNPMVSGKVIALTDSVKSFGAQIP